MTPRLTSSISSSLKQLWQAAAKVKTQLTFMEICGTHTVAAYRCGLPSLMPENVEMVSGPGCPVCVTSQGDIDQMVELSRKPGIVLCTYGDMMNVPGSSGTLAAARGEGADVRFVYCSLDAVRIARQNPRKQVVFAAVGFETTAPATAAALMLADQENVGNFTLLTSHKRVLPAVEALLNTGAVKVAGFVCPGHVAVILGALRFARALSHYRLANAIVGFEDWQLVEGLAHLCSMIAAGETGVVNLYPQVVSQWGNHCAQNAIGAVFEEADANWRGLGTIRRSGLSLRSRYVKYDARVRFDLKTCMAPEPKGCRCGDVITARCKPIDCGLFGRACTPAHPIGPCMVSSEGTCQAWFKYHTGRSIRRVEMSI